MTKEAFDPQRVVDAVVAGLASQGFRQSLQDTGRCAYNGVEGRHCAAGWLLKEGSQPKEGMAVVHETIEPCLQDWARPDVPIADVVYGGEEARHWSLLEALQSAHDEGTTPETMREHLRTAIDRFGLKRPQVLR